MPWHNIRMVHFWPDGRVRILRPAWNARLVSEYSVNPGVEPPLKFNPPVPAFMLIRSDLTARFQEFASRVTWAETEAEFLARVEEKNRRPQVNKRGQSIPPVIVGAVTRIDRDQMTNDHDARRWRDQWRWTGSRIEPDVALCRAKRLEEIREQRNQRLAASDPVRMRLLDQGTQQQVDDYKAYRQQLRDLPTRVQADLAALQTPDELDRYSPPWPVEP